ncbi:hypothetical protein [uncultured Kordia sp.]|uniref:hypothetical protein n=1 Tax=uncultured Kordia sp. TaxID=507699 RepID=UPI0026334EC1|nr:hypothetical protein [uncultured Kordia sp.]
MKKLPSLLQNLFSRKNKKAASLEKLKSKTEIMKAELESLSQFENFLKELNNKS